MHESIIEKRERLQIEIEESKAQLKANFGNNKMNNHLQKIPVQFNPQPNINMLANIGQSGLGVLALLLLPKKMKILRWIIKLLK